jgi:hypothetical protein
MGTFDDFNICETEVKNCVCGGEGGKECRGTHAKTCTDGEIRNRLDGSRDTDIIEELFKKIRTVTSQ